MESKQVKFRLKSWNKLRRAIYGRKDENFSDYIEKTSQEVSKVYRKISEAIKKGNIQTARIIYTEIIDPFIKNKFDKDDSFQKELFGGLETSTIN